jgi:hypothetical protein
MQRGVGFLVIVLLAGTSGCTSDPQPTAASSPSQSLAPSVASPTPSATKPPRLPITEARIEGKYQVRLYVTHNSFDSKPSSKQVFVFEPRCANGPCDVFVSGKMLFGQGLSDRQSAGAEKRFSIKLAGFGKNYEGTKVGFFAECNGQPDRDRWTFDIKIDKAKYVGDVWTVLKWSGIWTRAANFGGPCVPGKLKTVIRGTLQT